MPRMLGAACPQGPGGRDCPCCGQAPGRDRKTARRRAKRSERQKWRREARTS
ncbi:hypothetical protein BG846_03790 [Streptomyces fradiae ATCC 10745 = DSM 40063]|uniref:Uncharacterized protein n=1 Tax=Streptomyces fradiae ATCC 10745 = DSM 40063 TaxID=1319510 RepID=A0A1Y2NSX5_STRFR|nr:hypothetical protein BG846_03790 [Streptomyces fradiae ATCC 10745 = DSM 40063]